MATLQEVFSRVQETRGKLKELRASYKDALTNSAEFTKVDDEMKALRAKRKEVEIGVRSQFGGDFDKMDDLKRDLQTDLELINDLAINQIMEGETVTVKDSYDNNYEPLFSVKFRKFR